MVGSIRECDGIVYVANPDDVKLLWEYNKTHKNYVVVFEGRLSTSVLEGKLRYSELCNVDVVVEPFHKTHDVRPVAHFEGMIEQSGKRFMVTLDVDRQQLALLEKIQTECPAELRISPVKVRVTYSEKQQKGIVELI